ncbi:MAG: S16 family serine protease [Candidatus Nanopelagicales bacterium]
MRVLAPAARRSLVALAGSLVIVAPLAGCGSVINSEGDGYGLTVPVLWAGQGTDGLPTGGIESAGVWAGDDSTPGYSIDLGDIEAQGAGAAWRAASGTAASVGAFFSAVDPTTLGIRFTITGPIDGPSGGAALTVGVIAATRNQPLVDGVTMTGTIAPDGTIGRVSGIPAKLRAAAAAGYDTVLLPPENMTDRTSTDTSESMAEFGKTLGLSVVPAADIGDAYEQMTGTPLSTDAGAATPLSTPVAAAATSATSALITRFRQALKSAKTSAKVRRAFTPDFAAAESSVAAGDTAKGYALAIAGYRNVLRANARTAARSMLADSGAAEVQSALLAEATALTETASATRQDQAATTQFGIYQELAIPTALAPLTYAIAILEDTQGVIQTSSERDTLLTAATVIADQRATIDSASPTSFGIVAATPSAPSDVDAPAITLLSGYTNFLVNAGNANAEYFTEVLGGQRIEQVAPGSLSQLVQTLGEEAAAIPIDEQDLSTEFIQSSQALAYFIFSTALVTDQQAFEIRGEQLGATTGRLPNPDPVRNSIATGKATVDGTVATLAQRNVDAGLANWLATWGVQSAAVTQGSPSEVTGSLVALHQIWGASVNALILQAGADRFSE